MANRIRAINEATLRWSRNWLEVSNELREARLALGLTQTEVARALGTSRSRVSRIELAQLRRVSVDYLVRHGGVVGLRASFKFYPAGGALRDAAQVRYIAMFIARIGHAWKVRLDAPIPLAGDLRAVDVLLTGGAFRIAVEVITRLRDLQAQIRACQLKQRDIGADRLIIVLAPSHANRRALLEARSTVLASFDLDSRHVLAALSAGEDPGRDAIIFLG